MGPIQAREKKVLIGGTILALGIILYALVLNPVYSHYILMRHETPITYRKLKLYEKLVKEIPKYKAESDSLSAQYDAAQKRLLTDEKPTVAAAFLQALLQSLAEKNGISIEKIKVLKFAELERFTEIPVEISFKCPLDALTRYVGDIENNNKLLIINDFKVRSLKSEAKESLDTTLEVVGIFLKR